MSSYTGAVGTHTISTEVKDGKLNMETLEKELKALTGLEAGLVSLSKLGDTLTSTFKRALTGAEETIYNNHLSNDHDGTDATAEEEIIKTVSHIQQDTIKTCLHGETFTATKNSTTNHDTDLLSKYIKGAKVECTNNVHGDKVSFQVIDIDNVVGYGANTVLDEFAKDYPVPVNGIIDEESHAISSALPSGVYIRVVYKSVGTGNDVDLKLWIKGFDDV